MLLRKLFVGIILFSSMLLAQAPINIEEQKSNYFQVDSSGKYYFPTVLHKRLINLPYMDSDTELFAEFNDTQKDALESVLVDFILKDTTSAISSMADESQSDWQSFFVNLKTGLDISKMIAEQISEYPTKYDKLIKALKNGEDIDNTLKKYDVLQKYDLEKLINAIDTNELDKLSPQILDRIKDKVKKSINKLDISGIEKIDLDSKNLKSSLIKALEYHNESLQNLETALNTNKKNLDDDLAKLTGLNLKNNSKKSIITAMLENDIALLRSELKDLKNRKNTISNTMSDINKIADNLPKENLKSKIKYLLETKVKELKESEKTHLIDMNYLKKFKDNTLPKVIDGVAVGVDVISIGLLVSNIYSTEELINRNLDNKLLAIKYLKSLLPNKTYPKNCEEDNFDCMVFNILDNMEKDIEDNRLGFIKAFLLDRDGWMAGFDAVSTINSMINILGTGGKYFPKLMPTFFKWNSIYTKTVGKVAGGVLAMADDVYYHFTKQGFPKLGSQVIASHILYQLFGSKLNHPLDKDYYQQAKLIHAMAADAGRYLKNLYYFTPGFDEKSSDSWIYVSTFSDVVLDGASCGPYAILCSLTSSLKYFKGAVGNYKQNSFIEQGYIPDFIKDYLPIYVNHYSEFNYFKNRLKSSAKNNKRLTISDNFKIYYEKIDNDKAVYFIPDYSINNNLLQGDTPVTYNHLSKKEKIYLQTVRVVTDNSNDFILEDILKDYSTEYPLKYYIKVDKVISERIVEFFRNNVSREQIDNSNGLSHQDYGLPLGNTIIRLNNIEKLKQQGGKLQIVLNQDTKNGSHRDFKLDDPKYFIENKIYNSKPTDSEIKKYILKNEKNIILGQKNVVIDLNNPKGFKIKNKGKPWLIIINMNSLNILYLYGKNENDRQYTQLSLISGKVYGKQIEPFKFIVDDYLDYFVLFDSQKSNFEDSIVFLATDDKRIKRTIDDWQKEWLDEYLGNNWEIDGESYTQSNEETVEEHSTLNLLLPDGATINNSVITANKGDKITFWAGISAGGFRNCIYDAGENATFKLKYIDVANDGYSAEPKSLDLEFDNMTNKFAFNMPSSKIKIVGVSYTNEVNSHGFCELPKNWESTNVTTSDSDTDISDDYKQCIARGGTEIGCKVGVYTISSIDINDAQDVEIVDNYAYIADDSAGLKIVDISNPNQPILIASIDMSNAKDVEIVDNYAYVADGYSSFTIIDSGFKIIDISNPKKPILIASVDMND